MDASSSNSNAANNNRTIWSFSIEAQICPSSSFKATETIGSISCDKSQRIATAGIGRKIRVYNLQSLLDAKNSSSSIDADASAATMICTPARLSSVQWRDSQQSIIGSGDYDGVVTEWDMNRGVAVIERDEHNGRHVWSIDYSRRGDDLCISSSDDGFARLWPSNSERSVLALRSPSGRPVCCAEFSPESSHLVAMACADGAVYVHDLRNSASPVVKLAGQHQRAASYVRFLDQKTLVSASIDSSIVVWRLDKEEDDSRLVESFSSHRNVKNFVGLSVWGGKLIASGSETNQAFVYEVGSCSTAALLKHEIVGPANYRGAGGSCSSLSSSSTTFVSAVCWMQDSQRCGYTSLLAAANSEGVVHIISARQCSRDILSQSHTG